MTYRTNNTRFAIAVLVIFVFLCLHSVAAHYTYMFGGELGVAAISASLDRDSAREWVDSLRVRDREPPGEYEIQRLLGKRQQEDRKRDG